MIKKLEKIGLNHYRFHRTGEMNAHVDIYLSEGLFKIFTEEESLQQLIDAASLKGVVNPVLGMPDIHTGFGLPIGGIMAMDPLDGLVSAGAVGMDINCGVRLLTTNLGYKEIGGNYLRQLLQEIEKRVPSGVGRKSLHGEMIRKHYFSLLEKGTPFLVELGFGRASDPFHTEDGGVMLGADPAAVSKKAVDRGMQLSTLGGGNHFIEIGYIEKIYDRETSECYGLDEGTITVMIHTGSRGFGHQICTDYAAEMKKAAPRFGLKLPSSGLAAAPVESPLGKRYLMAMSCAVNFAYCNRQWITDDVRKAFASLFGGNDESYGLDLLYDLTHNTARFETISERKLLVHRKGATRALPPGHPDNPDKFIRTGHPVLVPGSMGSYSYILKGEPGIDKTFHSVNHGAGRTLSRSAAKKQITPDEMKNALDGVILSGDNYKAFLDEAPQAYKDINSVVDTFTEINLCRRVARLKPLAVIKGEE